MKFMFAITCTRSPVGIRTAKVSPISPSRAPNRSCRAASAGGGFRPIRSAASDAARQLLFGARLGDIGENFAVRIQTGELVQEIANINFIASEMAADGVCVN